MHNRSMNAWSLVAVLLSIFVIASCGGGGSPEPSGSAGGGYVGGGGGGGSGGDDGAGDASGSGGLQQYAFDLTGAIGLALGDAASLSSAAKGAVAGSNLMRINADNTLGDAVTRGTLSVQDFMVAANDNVYLLLRNPIPTCANSDAAPCSSYCLLLRVVGSDSAATNSVSCVDSTLTSIVWMNGLNPPIQFDAAGNVYYMGWDSNGMMVLRENADGTIIDLINDYIYLNDFLVLADGTVIVSGYTTSTGAMWTRVISSSHALSVLKGNTTTLLGAFPDGNAYLSSNGAVDRYLADSGGMDPKAWVEYSYEVREAYYRWEEDVGCYTVSSILKTSDDRAYAVCDSRLIELYPEYAEIDTSLSKITVAHPILTSLVLAGFDGAGGNKLVLLDTGSGAETDLLDGESVEAYHIGYMSADSAQAVMFDGLRFSDNSYVLCQANLAGGDGLVCSRTNVGRLTGFQLFRSALVGGSAGK